jgi:cytoskeleton protein RodZ
VGEFGDKFRKAREKKEFSLDDVSNVTKISARMLQAIEAEHFDQLPGGVFNKGFIRAYAKHLGLNDEEAVTEYLACLRQAQIDAHEVWDPQRTAQPRPSVPEKPRPVQPNKSLVKSPPPPPREELPELHLPRAEDVRPSRKTFASKSAPEIPWRILALAVVVVVLGVILWTRHSRSANTAAANISPAKTAQVAPVPVAASTPAPTNPPPATVPSGNPATLTHPSTPNSQPPQATVSAPAAHPSMPAAPASAASTPTASTPAAVSADDKNDVTIRSFAKSNPRPSAKSTPPLTLVIRATETSWISVLADGQPVSQETLIAPAHTSVRATNEIVVKLGNAAGVTFLWNGQEISAQGAEAEVKTFVFDANGMRVLPSTPSPAPNR